MSLAAAATLIIAQPQSVSAKLDTIEGQCAILFRHIRDIVDAAGGATDDINKMNGLLKDTFDRSALNAEWTAMFPESENQPARQAPSFERNSIVMIQCEFLAVLRS